MSLDTILGAFAYMPLMHTHPLFLSLLGSTGILTLVQPSNFSLKSASVVLYHKFFTNSVDDDSLVPLLGVSSSAVTMTIQMMLPLLFQLSNLI